MKLRYPSYAPDLKTGMKIQYAFRCIDEDAHEDGIIEWRAGRITIVSNGNKLRNPGKGPRCRRKGGTTDVQCDADVSKGKEVRCSIVKIKKNYSIAIKSSVDESFLTLHGVRKHSRSHVKNQKK